MRTLKPRKWSFGMCLPFASLEMAENIVVEGEDEEL